MAFSLYAATIPSQLQILGSMAGLVSKAEAWCTEHNMPQGELTQARLAPDMHPFAYQIKSTGVHSIGAIEGVRKGVFGPDMTPPPGDFAGLAERMAQTIAALEAVDPKEVDGWVGRDMRFEFGERRMSFTVEEFLLSFSQPNFYFHATTAYALLRTKGLPIGKRDFTGRVRTRA